MDLLEARIKPAMPFCRLPPCLLVGLVTMEAGGPPWLPMLLRLAHDSLWSMMEEEVEARRSEEKKEEKRRRTGL